MSVFRRRIIQRLCDAAQSSIKLPSYDEATYPYSALIKGALYETDTGIASGYSFVCTSKQHTTFYKQGYYRWKGGGTSVTSITFVSADGITWQQIGGVNKQTALSYITTVEEKIFDYILKT